MSNTPINELMEIGKDVFAAKNKIAELKAEIKRIEATISSKEARLLEEIEENELDGLAIEGVGKLYTQTIARYKLPQTEADRKAFYDYLKGITYGENGQYNMFDKLVSINSNTLNGFVKAKLDEDPMAKIPGIPQPFVETKLKSRKR